MTSTAEAAETPAIDPESLIVSELVDHRGNKFKIVFQPQIHASLITFNDEEAVRRAMWNIAPGDVIFDVGAAYGSYILPALAAGAAHVFAFSPGLTESLFLMRSLRVNGWESRCTLWQCGAYSKPGYLQVYSDCPVETFRDQPSQEHPDADGHFAVTTVDAVLQLINLSRLDWLKLDVEGCEAAVISGALATIKRYRPKILVEHHLFKDGNADVKQRIENVLLPLGYKDAQTLFNGFVLPENAEPVPALGPLRELSPGNTVYVPVMHTLYLPE